MKPKTNFILIAFLVNLGLILASPSALIKASAERSSSIWFPCCMKTSEERPYCCQNCCYFRWDCRSDEDCAPRR